MRTSSHSGQQVASPWLCLSFVLFPIALAVAADPTETIGAFTDHGDVGAPDLSGNATYDSTNQTYTLSGAGSNVWAKADQFHYAYRRIAGDFIIQARGSFPMPGVVNHRKWGVMLRETLDTDSAQVNAVVHGDGLTSLQYRLARGSTTEELKSSLTGADFIQLERRGPRCIMSVAHAGGPLVVNELPDIPLGKEALVGLFVCSHRKDGREVAVFSNVRVITPLSSEPTEQTSSDLEVLDLTDLSRTIVYRSPTIIEAPNWTPDGRELIFNGSGKLHRFNLAHGSATPIDTGSAMKLNNDHLVSADGTQIAISHGAPENLRQSIISVLPIGGGVARRITEFAPSYLHGWSPDGKSLLFVAKRTPDADFNIYAIPAAGGSEICLSRVVGHDDGPEYAPDGKAIWFNSNRSGTMQIWRMNVDGSEPIQVTHDENQNWFPHLSPDGKTFVYLSYEKDVPSDKHPRGKNVTLRLMPVTGGEPKVLAYVHGGQGTLNVPSWSPDGRKLAFVSFGNF